MKKPTFEEASGNAPGFSPYFEEIKRILSTAVNKSLVRQLVEDISKDILLSIKNEDVRTFLQLPIGRDVVRNSLIASVVYRGLKQALNLEGVTCFILNMESALPAQAGIYITDSFLEKVKEEVPQLGINNDGEFESDGFLMLNMFYNYKIPLPQTV